MGFLDSSGLSHFWDKVKLLLNKKQDTLTADTGIRISNNTISVETPVKSITKAEYDALSEEEKNSGLYIITDVESQTIPSLAQLPKFYGNHWENKKIVLLGTSAGFGSNATKAYMDEASKYLNFILVNTSVPGLAIHTEEDGSKLTYGSTSLSIVEYENQGVTIPSAPLPYIPGSSYNDYYRTWEHIFTEENKDTDLWVFAVAPNNTRFGEDDWNVFDKSSWAYSDGSTFEEHRTTFIGALLFLMDKMYSLNQNARMIFLLDSAFSYSSTEARGNIETIAKYWNIPIVDLWGKINTSPKSLFVIKSKDGTDMHPSTFAHERMGRMLVGELLGLA